MNKTVLMIFATLGMTIGAFVPMLWGDRDMLGIASLFWSMVGGFVGIWLGVKVSKSLG